MFANVWSRSIRSRRVPERTKHALVGLIVSFVLLGTLAGAGAGVDVGAAVDDIESSEQPFTGPTNESTVTLAQESDGQDNLLYAQLESTAITSGQSADMTTSQTLISHETEAGDEKYLVLATWNEDTPVVQWNGSPVRVADEDGDVIERDGAHSPDLQVVDSNTEIKFNPENGTLQTDQENPEPIVTAGGQEIKYDNYNNYVLDAEITAVNDPAEGEDLVVETTITNNGYRYYSGDQTVSFGDESSTGQLALDSGSETTETFTIETGEGDSSFDEVSLELDNTPDDVGDTREVDIADAEVEISDLRVSTPVAGDDLVVEADFERIGDVPVGDMTAKFSVGNETIATDDLQLSPGETEEGRISYETSSNDVPELDVGVDILDEASESIDSEGDQATIISQDDHEDNMNVEIPDDGVEIGEFGEELEVTGEFEYNGDEIPNQETDIPTEFLVNGTVVEERDVTIDESPYEETFTWEFNESTMPVENVSIQTPGGNDVTEFERNLDLEFEEYDDTFSSSESFETTVSVENDGEVPELQDLTVSVADEDNVVSNATQTREFLLNASERTEETFSFDLTPSASSGVELTANTSQISKNVTANRSMFEASDLELDGASDPRSNLSMSGNITNTGDLTDTQTVQFVLDGKTVFEEELTLESSESENVIADIESPEESGEYTYGITTNNESLNASSAVEQSSIIEGTADQGLLDRITPLHIGLLVLGLLALVGILLGYQNNPEAFRSRAAALTADVQGAVQRVLGGGDTVVVENGLSRDATVRLRVRDSNEVVFLEDLTLADGEQREFRCLPDSGEFEVGAGVDDIDSHAEVFQTKPNGVGVRLEPDGISITEQ